MKLYYNPIRYTYKLCISPKKPSFMFGCIVSILDIAIRNRHRTPIEIILDNYSHRVISINSYVKISKHSCLYKQVSNLFEPKELEEYLDNMYKSKYTAEAWGHVSDDVSFNATKKKYKDKIIRICKAIEKIAPKKIDDTMSGKQIRVWADIFNHEIISGEELT